MGVDETIKKGNNANIILRFSIFNVSRYKLPTKIQDLNPEISELVNLYQDFFNTIDLKKF